MDFLTPEQKTNAIIVLDDPAYKFLTTIALWMSITRIKGL